MSTIPVAYPELSDLQREAIYKTFSSLQGRILTVIDALLPEGQQNRAAKDVMTAIIWEFNGYLLNGLNPKLVSETPNAPVRPRKIRN